ncbi:MAG: TonB-dependent receptor [Bryobacterales bacterium]|nr:TonB-dependent receptor [Bryobacterales bacterium]
MPFVAWGQSTFATITGTATDPTGAAVPGVAIEARDTGTNYVYRATTNESGQYTIANLRDGTYVLRAKGAGFQEFQVDNIVLTGLDNRRINVPLQVGSVDTVVNVDGGATLIETESARISDVKDREVLTALPLTLRRAWDYFTLSPQINKTTGGFQVSFAGSRQNQGAANIDGTTIARSGGGFASGPLLDRTESFDELRMDISGTSAEFGTIGQVTLVSRAGTNDFHGLFSDYYSTTAFRVRNPFATERASGVAHRLAFAAGGPVFIPKVYNGKNKTFFFWTLEMGTGSPGRTQLNQTVPLPAWREGNFVGEAAVRDPLAGNAPFAGNVIPASRINRTAKAMQDRFLALPNFGTPGQFAALNYRELRTNMVSHQPTLMFRGDHRFNDKAFIYGRLTKVDWNLDNFEALPTITERYRRWRTLRAATIAYTHNIRTNLLNEARWGTSFDDLPNRSRLSGKQIVSELGITGLAPDVPDVGLIPRVSFQGLGLSPIEVIGTCVPCGRDLVQQFVDHVSWFRGNHNLKMGFQMFWGMNNEVRQAAGLYGNWTFSNRFTGNTYADFLLGVPSTLSRNFPAIEPRRYNYTYAGFVTDEWRVTRSLTLNLGLRYQLFPGWKEENGRQALFDVASGKIVVPDGSLNVVSPLMPRGYVDVIEASQAGYASQTLIRSDKNNFAPRFGFAWRPWGADTVIRGGSGFFFDAAPVGPSAGSTVPFNITEPPFTNPVENPVLFPVAFPSTGTGGPATVGLPNAIRPDLRVPLSSQYSLTLERQQWNTGFRVTYTGTNTRYGVYRWDINQPVADAQLYVDKARMFPRYPAINYTDNGAGHQYHGVSMEIERRNFKGLHYQLYYTLAKDVQDLENNESGEDAYNRLRERSTWGALPRHRWMGNAIYDLPVGRGRAFGSNMGRVADAILGGWQISSIYIYETGGAITPLWSGPDPTGTRFTNTRTRPIVTLRPDRIADGRLENPTASRWFDVNAFAAPALGRFGTSGKGVIYGTPINVLHGTLAKIFDVKERVKIRLEFLGNNVLNHPNWRDPNMVITDRGTAGVVTATMDRNTKFDSAIPREMQAQLRIMW